MHKKISQISLLMIVITLVFVQTAQAVIYQKIKPIEKRPLAEENKEKLEKLQGEVQDKIRERMASMPAWMKAFRNNRIAFGSGELTAIDGNTLTVVREDTTYTVLVDEKTQLRRKFWGKSDLAEFTVGDKLNVVGTWENEEKTTIRARFIRNQSIQMRHGVFFGTVTTKSDTGFTLESVRRGPQTVTVSQDTKYVNRRGETLEFSDILVGHRIRVRGLWNSRTSTITEVTQVKDFSLPEMVKPSGRPSVNPEASTE